MQYTYFALLTLVATVTAIATGRVYRQPSATSLAASSLALAIGFVVLCACVALTYIWGPAQAVQGQILVAAPALLSFGALFITHIVKHKPMPAAVLMAAMLCGFAIYFFGLFVWLFTACVFGDCI
jgi:hypothetical protein